jgi:hypothetical protein
MFDPQEVVSQVEAKRYPPQWRVFLGIKDGCSYSLQVVLFSFLGLFLFSVVLVAILNAFGKGTSLAVFEVFVLSWLIGMLAIVSLCVWWAVRAYKADGRSCFVILPEGIVMCYRGQRNKVSVLYFEQIQKLSLDHQTVVTGGESGSSSTLYAWFNVFYHNGTYVKWDLPTTTYGNPIALGGNVVAAYERFLQQRGQR